MRTDKGFTLLEVLLAIIILGGAGFFLLVKIPFNLQEQNITLSSAQMKSELREVQQAAIAENTWYRVKFYPDAEQYNVYKQGSYQRSIQLAEGVTFGNRPPDLIFLPTGSPSIGMTIVLLAGERERRIIIAPVMGRIREQIVS